MIKKIHKLRQKTQAEKERIAFAGAIVVTLFIVLFWLAGVTNLSESNNSQRAQVGSPVQELVESFVGVFRKN